MTTNNTPSQKKTVLLMAPVISRSGYGEHARLVYESLLQKKKYLNIRVWLSNWGQTPNDVTYFDKYPDLKEHVISSEETNALSYDVGIWLGVPNEFPRPQSANRAYLVGITAGIETDIIDDSWAEIPTVYNKICVVSDHAKKGFINHAVRKKTGFEDLYKERIQVIPYPVKNFHLKESDHILEQMDISTSFNFLSVAQMGPRKNIETLVRAFVEQFHDNKDVGLILKSNIVNNSRINKEQCLSYLSGLLTAYPNRECKIHHIHGNLTEEELHSLYVSDRVNAYITTTHGEGYGLPIFEAAYSGLPVIAPAWSGHCDFLYAPKTNDTSGRTKKAPYFTKIKYTLDTVHPSVVWKNLITPESKWANCDPEDVKKKMKEFFNKNNTDKDTLDKKNARLLKEYLVENFTKEKILDMYQENIVGVLDLVKNGQEIEEWDNFLSEMIE